MEVVDLARLFRPRWVVVDAGQRRVAVGFVGVGAVALRLLFLQQAQALPEKGGFFRLRVAPGVIGDLFFYTAPQRVVVVVGLVVQGCAVPGLRLDQAVFTVVGKALHPFADPAFFAEVAPGVVGETQVVEGFEAVVRGVVEKLVFRE